MILVDTSVWIDHLLSGTAQLWTRDKRLAAVATDLGISFAKPA